ncbi:MAG: DUF882 domain-containing protein [Minicystis sp.]
MRRSLLACVLGVASASSCDASTVLDDPPPPAEPTPVLVTLTPIVDPEPQTPEPQTPEPQAPEPAAWARALPPIRFVDTHHGAACNVRLYADDGTVDEQAASSIDRILAEPDAIPRPFNRRVLQLVVKAAAHFDAKEVLVVSSFRDKARKGSHHRNGEALDFSLAGVTAMKLAAYLRKGSRVGVGVYTHPRTQFVHLDVRPESYHWADASPPGRWWRESRMTDRAAPTRDAAYRPEQDLPGG